MAVMDSAGRTHAWINLMKSLSSEVDLEDSTVRSAMLAAVEDVDDWIDDNLTSYNSALSEPFKSWSTPRQKAAVLTFVVHGRFNAGTE